MNKLPIIGITIGDINSIAPEIVLKTLQDNRITDYCTPVIYASTKLIGYWKKVVGMNDFYVNIIKYADQAVPKKVNLINCWEEEVEIKIGEANSNGGKYAFKSLEAATKDLKEKKLDGIVTAPLNKNLVNSELLPFKGHTEYLAHELNAHNYLMLLVSDELKVGLVTSHVPIHEVAQNLSKETILKKLVTLNESLKVDFNCTKPRIAVLGLNPHAGDNGLIGKEEKEIIIPAIEEAQKKGIMAFGPYPSDGFFGSRQFTKFDGVLAMYHDQGLIPFKLFAFNDGVNYTAGLNFVRTSPDHGTAYDIAGKNKADESSMRNALYLALDIITRKTDNADLKSNVLPFQQLKRERFRMDF
jgi:4-hydroxythreonine-4-phosphate dehydrogenase